MMRGRQFSWKNAFFSMVMSFFNGFFSDPLLTQPCGGCFVNFQPFAFTYSKDEDHNSFILDFVD